MGLRVDVLLLLLRVILVVRLVVYAHWFEGQFFKVIYLVKATIFLLTGDFGLHWVPNLEFMFTKWFGRWVFVGYHTEKKITVIFFFLENYEKSRLWCHCCAS